VRYGATGGGGGGEAVGAGHVRALTESLRALCVVILVEALDLEGIVEQIQSESGGGNGKRGAAAAAEAADGHAMVSEGALQQVAGALKDWPSDAVHGPVLLAWATLLALVPAAAAAVGTGDGAQFTLPPEEDAGAAAARASAGDAGFASLLALLRLDPLRGAGGGMPVTLHKVGRCRLTLSNPQ